MITLRRSEERGHANHGWLDSLPHVLVRRLLRPARTWASARCASSTRTASPPGQGFGTHPHRDMEIVSYVLEGALEHKDSMGNGLGHRAGRRAAHERRHRRDAQRVQRARARTASTSSRSGSCPSAARHRAGLRAEGASRTTDKRGRLRLVASPDGRDGSVTIHQDASVYAALFSDGEEARHVLADGRHAYVHVAKGEVKLGETVLRAGDGAAVSGEKEPSSRVTEKER